MEPTQAAGPFGPYTPRLLPYAAQGLRTTQPLSVCTALYVLLLIIVKNIHFFQHFFQHFSCTLPIISPRIFAVKSPPKVFSAKTAPLAAERCKKHPPGQPICKFCGKQAYQEKFLSFFLQKNPTAAKIHTANPSYHLRGSSFAADCFSTIRLITSS